MKYLLVLLCPFYLHAQEYRLDSIRTIDSNSSTLIWYEYESDQNFTRHYESFKLDNPTTKSHFFHVFKDSLEMLQGQVSAQDTHFTYLEYDDLGRHINSHHFFRDSLKSKENIEYHLDTNLETYHYSLSFKNGDTAVIHEITFTYDTLLRIESSSHITTILDTLHRANYGKSYYPNDTTSMYRNIIEKPQGVFDTFYSKTIELQTSYFSDTMRTWKKYFELDKNGIELSTDEEVEFTWGDFNKFEDAGQFTYLHGILYGSRIDYEPIPGGYTFIAYESGWPETYHDDWTKDFIRYSYESHHGTLLVNDQNLPVERHTSFSLHSTSHTYWYYSTLQATANPAPSKSIPLTCMIVQQLEGDANYYDMTGRQIWEAVPGQYLIKQVGNVVTRVLFISN